DAEPMLPILPRLGAVDAVRELAVLVREAREQRARVEAARKALDGCVAEESRAARALDDRRREVEALWQEAGLPGEPSDDALDAVVHRAEEAHALAHEVEQRRVALAREWWMGLDAALAEIGGRSEEELGEEAARVAHDRAALEAQRDALLVEEGGLKSELAKLEAPEGPEGEAAQALADAQGRVLEKAEEIAALKAGLFLIEQAKNRASAGGRPLIEAASAFFRALTGGAYTGLEIDRSGKEPALLALSANGPARTTTQLSDGTLDQIWLALRLAVARKAAQEGPLPIVLDDVFVHFDDGRTVAALKLLAELSHELQIIVFTHHDHVVDLARAAVAEALEVVVLARPEAQDRERLLPVERVRIERPPAPALQLEMPGLGAPRGPSATNAAAEAVLKALGLAGGPLSKPEIFEAVRALGADVEPDWAATLKHLKQSGRIEQVGAGRGTRYTLAASDVDKANAG
ncbi:MAG: hypothetical protein ACK4N5_16925, partial [Myxococcales bacterium]